MKNTERFSNRVENYVRYRPHYPDKVLSFLRVSIGLNDQWVIADIGSGTGILVELFLKAGNRVFAVEPNAPMRSWAEDAFASTENFISVDGSAEATGLPDASVDLITAGQAFHWFDQAKAKPEFQRIAKPGASLLLLWNERDLNSPLQQEYEQLLLDLAVDYSDACQHMIQREQIAEFFAPEEYKERSYGHAQYFTLEEFMGRLLSCSYAPLESHPNHRPMMQRLEQLFEKYNEDGQLAFEYQCKLYLGPVLCNYTDF